MWSKIRPLIAKGLQYSGGSHTTSGVYADLWSGRKQLLLCENPVCILITELLNYPSRRRVCNVFLTAGTLPNDWRGVLKGIEEWAREKGCTAIEMSSPRKGWTRRLPDWRPVTVIYRKELVL